MILLARVPKHILPEHVEPHTIKLRSPDSNVSYLLLRIWFDEMVEWRREHPATGRPKWWAIERRGRERVLHVYPTPDKDYTTVLEKA